MTPQWRGQPHITPPSQVTTHTIVQVVSARVNSYTKKCFGHKSGLIIVQGTVHGTGYRALRWVLDTECKVQGYNYYTVPF